MAKGRYVSYLRVSTDRQGRSGLGLEAQRKAVEDFLNGGRWDLIAELVEVESGKRDDRPKLDLNTRFPKAILAQPLTLARAVVSITPWPVPCRGTIRLRQPRARWVGGRCGRP